MTSAEFLDWSIYVTFVMVMLSLAVAFVRLAKGPTLADRVVALDMMTISIIAVCGVAAVATGVYALLDVALVLALVGFLATVALARFAERREARGGGPEE
ncbi:monovalent cation/H+ antiporter complex subunit F [Yoonia sp. F2084L]|uniref:monovalent cation/H+ antiporter complex subunit F n=1 Tax=Yoonia sp. F2084L TaxID=2926419 RepID=UPI001FF142CA|nr:monovalent cation/H+ antiporter complex subunit F [Yoonia sp. F2084L]MCK0094365.1 monovalent cation/H+ antiporter complex subunit F [Yoonia sp. F2084L]